MDKLPVQTGTYTLLLTLSAPKVVTIGQLGRFELSPGVYAYQGSAWGSGGLRGRLGRHLKGTGRKHWHVDYLRAAAEVRGYGYLTAGNGEKPFPPKECIWSQNLAALPGASLPIPGFGGSDCTSGCFAHLVYFEETDCLGRISQILDQPLFLMT
jgi:Uri superfamily endonuclease